MHAPTSSGGALPLASPTPMASPKPTMPPTSAAPHAPGTPAAAGNRFGKFVAENKKMLGGAAALGVGALGAGAYLHHRHKKQQAAAGQGVPR